MFPYSSLSNRIDVPICSQREMKAVYAGVYAFQDQLLEPRKAKYKESFQPSLYQIVNCVAIRYRPPPLAGDPERIDGICMSWIPDLVHPLWTRPE